MKANYLKPIALFRSLQVQEKVADVCWAYSANNKENIYWYTGYTDQTAPTVGNIIYVEWHVLPQGNCDANSMSDAIDYVTWGGDTSYQDAMNARSAYYAWRASFVKGPGGNSGEPYNGPNFTSTPPTGDDTNY